MPTLITKGTMSAQALGFLALQQGGGGVSNWIGVFSGFPSYYFNNSLCVRVDTSNNVYVAFNPTTLVPPETFFAKIDTTPSLVWQYNVSGLVAQGGPFYNYESFKLVSPTGSGDWHAIGYTVGGSVFENITKFNTTNSQIWNEQSNDSGGSINSWGMNGWPDSLGNLIVATTYECKGFNEPGTPTNISGYLETSIAKRDASTGADIWRVYYRADTADSMNATGYSVCNVSNVDNSGNFYGLFWQQTSYPENFNSGKLCKFNSSGSLLWTREITYGGNAFNVMDVKCNADGTVAAILKLQGAPTPTSALFVFDASGTLLWQKWLAGGNARLTGADVDDSGNVYLVGTDYTYSAFFAAKYDTSGTKVWAHTFYNNTFQTYGFDVILDNFDNVIVAGLFDDNAGVNNIVVLNLPNAGPTNGTYDVNGFEVIIDDALDADTASSWSVTSGSMITSPYTIDFGSNPLTTSAQTSTFDETPL